MPQFLTGNKLNAEIGNLIEEAQSLIVIVSPYIKLHERYASALKTKLDNHNVQLIIVFGKNEEDMSKSIVEEDFNFFKQFPNVFIYFEKRLHAKYIANESASIITSMNFYKYSQDNNIEVGVKTERVSYIQDKLGAGENAFESEAWEYFQRVIDQSDLLFKKEPEIESGFLGIKKSYKGSKVITDKLSDFFKNKNVSPQKATSYQQAVATGFCIRTGTTIPFNLSMPLSPEAYQSWLKFSNKDYKEKFCHFSGEPSNGETTFSKPILYKNFKQAREKFKL
ncbi:MAG: hypothetical protein IT236_05690 [Bacteroidia bacterium]|nr:hypothetical protein [Bacteroidia bacterium]